MTRRAWRRRDSFSASMKRTRIDLRDFFRAMPYVATGSREPASAFMKSILCEGTDRDESVLPAARKMLCIPNAAITSVRGPRRCESGSARSRCPRHPNGRGKWKKKTGARRPPCRHAGTMTAAKRNSSTPPVVPQAGQKLPCRYFARRAIACRMMFSICVLSCS